MRDGTRPKTIGIIHCVGSRDHNTNRWCSKVCCMYSLKLAHLMKEHTGAEIFNFYIDMRTPGKGYEEFYDRLLDEGVHFIRGRVAEISDWAAHPSEEGKLVIRAEDTLAAFVRRIPVDMVVLSVGLEPQQRRARCAPAVQHQLFHRRLVHWNAIPSWPRSARFTDGIFIAGACQGPKDIPETVAQAGAAAAEAHGADRRQVTWSLSPTRRMCWKKSAPAARPAFRLCPYHAISFAEEKKKASINEVLCKGCGTCVAACPSGSIQQNFFEDQEIFEEIEGVLAYA